MWRDYILVFAEKLEHPAWGFNHCNRVYKMAMDIAAVEGLVIDEEVLFAAAYIHDIGAFEPYKKADVDHAERSVQLTEETLNSLKFPQEKIKQVKEVVEHHMFYSEVGPSSEAVVFRDADILDFMGVIGITRILSIIGKDDWTPNLEVAVELIQKFSDELLEKVMTDEAYRIGTIRKLEMDDFLSRLSLQTENLEYL
jgi:uncharacterized protein